MQNQKEEIKKNTLVTFKKKVYVTGMLLSSIKPGEKVVYIHEGKVIQTTPVISILKVTSEYVCFETSKFMYTLKYMLSPIESRICA